IELYGTVDELNASLGLAAAAAAAAELLPLLRAVQNDLFVVGSHLATPDHEPPSKTQWLPPLDEQLISKLELQIDSAESRLAPLRNFILPGGAELSARLHVARTVCRRAERLAVDFSLNRPVSPIIVTYLNRLSDWLFVHARLANHLAQVQDVPWISR
ncbi:MAG TPA: cob(I)yrinic acid a,c-diamide adenosyltransferase, partial [Tepidisphaeraceae bacterium]|nr:cob(I)yrinic acid a,c-diamide adenosyltransferase [Tepidisphaeraceae bacterium]